MHRPDERRTISVSSDEGWLMTGRRQEVDSPLCRSAASIRRWVRLFAFALALLAAAHPGTQAGAADTQEYEYKALYLTHFIKFVEWPAQRLSPSSPSIQVCVAGKDAYRAMFDTINGQQAKGKTIVVIQYSGPQDLSRSQLLFVAASERARLAPVLENARAAGVLTVGETPGFARETGIIGFRVESNKLRFDINPQAAEKSGLTLSAQLLKLARLVQ
jgi:hypothetical protein